MRAYRLIFQIMEARYWTRHFTVIGSSLLGTASAILHHSRFSLVAILNLLDLLFIAVPVIALAFGWRRLPPNYSLFALGITLFSLSFPVATFNPLAFQPHYLMAAFPIILVLALWAILYPSLLSGLNDTGAKVSNELHYIEKIQGYPHDTER